MKSACVFAAVACAGASAPPRISLKLEGMTGAYMLKHPIYRTHDLGLTQPARNGAIHKGGDKVSSRQDWTEKCPANRMCENAGGCEAGGWKETNAGNCPSPQAVAYDFNDGELLVTTRIFLIDVDGNSVEEQQCQAKATAVGTAAKGNQQTSSCEIQQCGPGQSSGCGVQYNDRSTWLMKYDAQDRLGNHAEQVVFALMLDDVEAPFFDANCRNADNAPLAGVFHDAVSVEAASDWKLCDSTAYDNVDSADGVTNTIVYQVDYIGTDRHNSAHGQHTEASFGVANWGDAQQNIKTGTYAEVRDFFRNSADSNKIASIGDYLVTATVHDFANIYGHDAVNNVRIRKQSIKVVDTVKPWIELPGSQTEYIECSSISAPEDAPAQDNDPWYVGGKGVCIDALDTEALDYWLAVTTTYTHHVGDDHDLRNTQTERFVDVNNHTALDSRYHKPFADLFRTFGTDHESRPVTTRELKYSCEDVAGNEADSRTRTVKTVDTLAPTIYLTGDAVSGQITINPSDSSSFATYNVPQSACNETEIDALLNWSGSNYAQDSCASSNNDCSAADPASCTADLFEPHVSWGPRTLNCATIGLYVRTFTVTDDQQTGNVATGLVHVNVLDDVDPVLEIIDGPRDWQASRTSSYVDPGANCNDSKSVDWDLNHAVEVSGDVVNMRVPGTYFIRYDCMDLSGNEAQTQTRTVVVKDTENPYLNLIGNSVNYVEAGFPYHDAGCTATDTLDGDVTRYIYTDGNTVQTSEVSPSSKSCQAIWDHVHDSTTLNNGVYYLNGHTEVKCYFHQDRTQEQPRTIRGYTYFRHTTAVSQANCAAIMDGMVKLSDAGNGFTELRNYLQEIGESGLGDLDDYVCVYNNDATAKAGLPKQENLYGVANTNDSSNLGEGQFRIKYFVKDKAGNSAVPLSRTVIVKDTLPPVITLKLNTHLVHNSGVNHAESNPADPGASNIKDVGQNHYRVGGLAVEEYPHTRKSWGQDEQFGGNSADFGALQYQNGDATTVNNVRAHFDQDKKYNQYNPAAYSNTSQYSLGNTFGNPNLSLMAESVSSNGWLVAAAASAVAGVALLGYSSRKSASISVPV
jgi:hypothetical protein